MNITLALVISVNGKLTDGEDPNVTSWTSPEDQAHFLSLVQKSSLIIMGRKTYEASKGTRKLVPGKLRVVITKNPDAYKKETVPGQLEFTDESPLALIKRLESEGYTEALLAGGSEVATKFFNSNLVDAFLLTIEPLLFKTGTQFINELDETIHLKLQSVQRLNKQGTLLFSYQVNTGN